VELFLCSLIVYNYGLCTVYATSQYLFPNFAEGDIYAAQDCDLLAGIGRWSIKYKGFDSRDERFILWNFKGLSHEMDLAFDGVYG
jgi:hypothetical protein